MKSIEDSVSRIRFLDGLRGVAIISVILCHAFVRWPDLYPYGNKFTGNQWLDTTGAAGVNLFFVISGFVILMTLRRCASLKNFLIHRWLRLFPAMLICSLLIYVTQAFFPERPLGPVNAIDLIPGITFLGDGFGLHSIEGPFWSLYVEVKFYLIFGILYFLIGEMKSVWMLGFVFLVGHFSFYAEHSALAKSLLTAVHAPSSFVNIISIISDFCHFQSYGFFVMGALLFLYYGSSRRTYLYLALGIGLVPAIGDMGLRTTNLLFILLIWCALQSHAIRVVLANRFFLWVGFISYPLYLVHEGMMVALIVKIGRYFPEMPFVLMPFLPVCAAAVLAWIIAKFIEPRTRLILRGLWSHKLEPIS